MSECVCVLCLFFFLLTCMIVLYLGHLFSCAFVCVCVFQPVVRCPFSQLARLCVFDRLVAKSKFATCLVISCLR